MLQFQKNHLKSQNKIKTPHFVELGGCGVSNGQVESLSFGFSIMLTCTCIDVNFSIYYN